MLTQNTYIDKRTIEGLTVGTYIISLFQFKNNKSKIFFRIFTSFIPVIISNIHCADFLKFIQNQSD